MEVRLRFWKSKGMRFLALVFLVYTWASHSFAQTNCDPDGIIPVWSRDTPDGSNYFGPHYQPGPKAYLNANFDSKKMAPKLEVALSWIKGYFEGITGARYADYQFSYYKESTEEEVLATNRWYLASDRIGNFYLRVSSKKTNCSNGRLYEYDGPAWIDINFNNLNHLARYVSGIPVKGLKEIPYLINGKPAFQIPKITRTKGNIDYYQYPGPPPETTVDWSNWYFLDVFVIRKNNKPLFISFTRKEILESKLIDLEQIYSERKNGILEFTQVSPPEEFDRELEERIAEIKRFTEQGVYGYYKENLESRIQLATENNRMRKEEEANKIENALAELNQDYETSVELIQDYLNNQPASELAKPVREYHPTNFGADLVRRMIENFDKELTERDWGQNLEIGYINPDYFDPKLSPDVPQLIGVEFVNLQGIHTHLNEVVERIKEKMDFKALQALFPTTNLAGAPASEPVKIVVKSPARYLEKLEELGPDPFPPTGNSAASTSVNLGGPGFNAAPIQVKFPERSSSLGQLSNLSTSTLYESYLDQIKSKFLDQLTPEQRGTYDQWIREYDLKTVEDFTQLSMLSWINSNPLASIYLDLEAVKRFPTSGLAANNLAVHLTKSGYPEKALPILEYWLKEFPDNSLLLGNAATANYYLGDVEKAFLQAKLTVEQDSLHPNANKILAFVHYRKGQKEPAKKASERSLEGSYDEEVVALLQEIDPEGQVGDAIYKGRKRPYTPQLLEKFKMPEAIQSIDDAEDQSEVIEEVLGSIELTLAAIPRAASELTMQQAAQKNIQKVMSGGGIPIMQMIGQHMYFKSLQLYQEDYSREKDRFISKLKELSNAYAIKAGEISRQYDTEMGKIEGGEDYEGERKLAELAKSKCAQLNLALDEYYKETAPLINQAVVRLELISRDHHSTIAYWAPIWLQSQEAADFPGTQINYLRDMRELLKLYPTELPIDCELFEEEEKDENVMLGKILVWEDQFCPVKYTVSAAVVKMGVNCNTFSLSGGEFFQVELEVKLNNDWDTIEEVTAAAGIGVSLDVGLKNVTMASAGLSSKGFLKLSKDPKSLEWNFREIDAGVKTEATVGGEIGSLGGEIKMAEVGMGFRSGVNSDGLLRKGIDMGIDFGLSN
jgi:hypothetical protein